ncbi:nuclear receptor coactivator 7 isoform X2 [Bufo gargarizans]|uniref:nuclear receptor coactivator 7 isoform X2 n=1 Tax=Bufo gargarizans TaxID=30331 RepID=UPI001CF3A09A|nr:nuclear receptor coactivator 7 isoform X2 [Bufo gargarizans]XP_044145421.1 nuclear receptor coactivator 7 isoform X2 [Bufo gargarizans]
MDSKEEKKERRPGYFARLKKRKSSKQNPELATSNSQVDPPPSKDSLKVILGQVPEKVPSLDEEKKKKKGQAKQLRRSENKKHSSGEIPNNKSEKKEKKMVMKKPLGTIEYTASNMDTLNSIALRFNITPNKLVELNKLFTHTIVPGQVLYVPVCESHASVKDATTGILASPLSSDAEYDKLPDADMARKASKPIERVLSSTSEEEEPIVVKFLKMNCRYITDGKGVVGGVMIVTPNNVMFDPHKSDPLVIENGCEEYGLICPMEEVVSIALYSDISHMKIKDALPSDIPKDLCPLYRPGEWEDLSSEKDINPFSKFKHKGKRQNGVTGVGTVEKTKIAEVATEQEPDTDPTPDELSKVHLNVDNIVTKETEQKSIILDSETKKSGQSPVDEHFIELVESLSQQNGNNVCEVSEGHTLTLLVEGSKTSNSAFPKADFNCNGTVEVTPKTQTCDLLARIDIADMTCEKENDNAKNIELCQSRTEVNRFVPSECVSDKPQEKDPTCIQLHSKEKNEEPTVALSNENVQQQSGHASEESPDSLTPCSPEENSQKETEMDSESELKLWLLKRMQGPIEDMLPSKEEKSKIPPMFLCIKVGKPMRKSFATQTIAMVQQYARKRKQPEYWFAVPQERVDHLYTFFVQWSPEVYGKDAKEQGFVVVEKDELDMIDNFFSEPSTKSWEIITVEEAKRRKSTCSYDDEKEGEETLEDFLPDLKQKSNLLEDTHIEKLAHRLPARVQGYPWHLVYSTHQHGTSLKTLYRNVCSIDRPVLLVVKDMDNQVFGAYATHPFRISDHYYGTGETFLFTFNPDFKAFKWSGENSYFINGDTTSLELGGGGGRSGLWLDCDLYHGRSNPCATFNNDILSKKEDFIVQDLEVWTFD